MCLCGVADETGLDQDQLEIMEVYELGERS